jgi:hypothetical protein
MLSLGVKQAKVNRLSTDLSKPLSNVKLNIDASHPDVVNPKQDASRREMLSR